MDKTFDISFSSDVYTSEDANDDGIESKSGSTISVLKSPLKSDVCTSEDVNEEASKSTSGDIISDSAALANEESNVKHCPNHKDKLLEYICKTHDVFGCTVCMITKHKSCKDVAGITEVVSSQYATYLEELKIVALKAEGILNKCKRNSATAGQRSTYVLETVINIRKEMNSLFDKVEKEIKIEADQTLEKDVLAISAAVQTCNDVKDEVSKLVSCINALEEAKHRVEMLSMMKKENAKVKQMSDTLEKANKNIDISKYTFKSSAELIKLLDGSAKIGNLKLMDPKTASVKADSDWLVRTDDDTEVCSITGLAMIDTHQVAMIDATNRKLKLFDMSQARVVSVHNLSSKPAYDFDLYGITSMEHQIALTMPSERKIALMTTHMCQFVVLQEIPTEAESFRIATAMDNFVVSAYVPTRLDIRDTHGNLAETIPLENHGFIDVAAIATSPDCGQIYVSNASDHSITSLSLWQKQNQVYSSWYLRGSAGVAVDQSGLVYIAGNQTSNIHQMTADCKKVRILLSKSDGVVSPQVLCHCDVTDRLFISSKNSDVVKVFKMS